MKVDTRTVESFGHLFFIVCPRCRKQAKVATEQEEACIQARLICASCGLAKAWVQKHTGVYTSSDAAYFSDGQICIGAPVDWYFHEPLWLQEPCCGRILWAYNSQHLQWLREFVSAGLREREPDADQGWSNRSLASRLPGWIKKASNRHRILQAVTRLEKRLKQAG
jgi:Zn ribbon nucleic-acid-binding protein